MISVEPSVFIVPFLLISSALQFLFTVPTWLEIRKLRASNPESQKLTLGPEGTCDKCRLRVARFYINSFGQTICANCNPKKFSVSGK